MNYIRLKTNLQEKSIQDRLQYNPEIIEFFLNEQDIENPTHLIAKIKELQNRGIKVFMHHPMKYKGKRLDILSQDLEVKAFYEHSSRALAEICHQENIHCIVHAHYGGTESSENIDREHTLVMKEAIKKILAFSRDRFLWEDTIEGLFSYANPYLFEELIVPLNLSLNVDVSHTFIALKGNNEGLERVLKMTQQHARYYHLVDSKGEFHDSLPLGEGLIHWDSVKKYVEGKDFIFEINLTGDHTDCTPMIQSAEYFKKIDYSHYSTK